MSAASADPQWFDYADESIEAWLEYLAEHPEGPPPEHDDEPDDDTDPRTAPVDNDQLKEAAVDASLRSAQEPSPIAVGPVLVTMADVKPQALRWLWRGRVPSGAITILDGDPGLGKSIVTVDLAARVSQGLPMPDGTGSDLAGPADVLMVFCEDDPAATVRPRLDAAGADVRRVHQLVGTQQPNKDGIRPFSLADVTTIRAALASTRARLVTIDPWAAYIGGRDSRSDEKMRELLTPLADIARFSSAAIVIVRHLRKAAGPAVASGAGSIGIAGAARSVLLVAQDPADEESRVLAVSKGNLSAKIDSLRFQVEADSVQLPDGDGVLHQVAVPRIVWKGASSATADALLAAARADPVEKTEQAGAEEWLLEALKDDPLGAEDLQRFARKAGYSDRTFERARAGLCNSQKIWKHRSGGKFGSWWWGLGAAPSEDWLRDRAAWERNS